MFSTVTFHDVASSNLNFWPGTPLPPRAIWGLGVFPISGESLEFYNQDLFKKTNTQTQMGLTLLSLSGVAATCNSKRSSVSMLANSSLFSSMPGNRK